jgi:hypothetical protein
MLGPLYSQIINRAINAPIKTFAVYEQVRPSLKPRFIQAMCFELQAEAARNGVDIPSAVIFRAETYASKQQNYVLALTSVLAIISNDIEEAKKCSRI